MAVRYRRRVERRKGRAPWSQAAAGDRKAPSRPLLVMAISLFAISTGCDGSAPLPIPEVPFEPLGIGTVTIETEDDTLHIRVEIASTASTRAYGLMNRDSLGRDEGMLFVFDEDRPADAPFHMYRTRIPLDIAFIDAEGVLVSVLTMDPCPYPVASFCPTYAPGATYRLALEVNAGYFAENGVAAGARLVAGS